MKGKSLKFILYLLLLVSVVIGVMFLVLNQGQSDGTMVSPLLNWAYILLGVAILLAIFTPILFRNGRGGKKTLVEIIVLAAVVLLAFLLASGKPVALSPSVSQPTDAVLKMTDTALITSIILLVGAICAAIFGSLLRRKS